MTVRRLTPAGPGAVAVLELFGSAARARLASLVSGPLPRPGRLHLARLVAGGEVLDEALVVGLGEARFELHLHGGPAVVARVAQALGGLAAVEQPESLEDRARALVPGAASEAGARILLDQAQGALRAGLDAIRGLDRRQGRREIERLIDVGRRSMPLLCAPRVVLAGPTNAGKSTLFNLLVGTDRALTSQVHGTTRDALVERGVVGRLVVEWVDTAGERELPEGGGAAADEVERAGQALARSLRSAAELTLWIHDGAVPAPPGVVPLVRGSRATATEGDPPAIATLEDPEGTRALVGRLVARHVPHGSWEAGRPVPFEPELIAELARLAALEPRERDLRLGRLFSGPASSNRRTAR